MQAIAPVRFGFLATIKGTYQGYTVEAAQKLHTVLAAHPVSKDFPWTVVGHITERSFDVTGDNVPQLHDNQFQITLDHNDVSRPMNTRNIYSHLGDLKQALSSDPQHTFSIVA